MGMDPLVTVSLLIRNHSQYIEACLKAVLAQTYQNIETIAMDNDSSDDSVDIVRSRFPSVPLVCNKKNLGYSGGHNKAIRMSSGTYFMALNPDVFMTPRFIEEKVRRFEKDPSVGMMDGKLLKAELRNGKILATGLIDSTGLLLKRNRRNTERGSREKDRGRYEGEEFIFGPFGAAPMYRRKMLEDIKLGEEYFDEDFFAYREEVDLAWRGQLRGWKCLYVPQAIAYHVHAYNPETRKSQPKTLRRMQFRNRYFLMIKNDQIRNMLLHMPYILSFELAALAYVLLREPFLLRGYLEVFKAMPRMRAKRRLVRAMTAVPQQEIRKWFS